jgi:hypothetical protein
MGRVAQILDDVEDMEEDLQGGRFTYPAKILSLRSGVGEGERFVLEWRSLASKEWGEDLAATLDAALDRASEEAGQLATQAAGVVEEYRSAVVRLRESGSLR